MEENSFIKKFSIQMSNNYKNLINDFSTSTNILLNNISANENMDIFVTTRDESA